ncbi:right-handed parallel beta-helix repeat-containing protein [Flavivirga aquimarina]|uniref:Right-handed parallel beta-helix repeat-containing protein n=1 Tax=Flavivirga aquimarina TaxID=2027862 RepID=A0ABT8WFA4_9FLAO|nr:right-handed parallel beta-helix repeat-containing protein [Flavivirga aquimarina]MDO5971791.1 right-handed parallel beta-helix repeat-containing protein [Flavivirga aquimarina]
MKKQVLKNNFLFLMIMFMQVSGHQYFAQNRTEDAWTVRYNTPKAQELFTISTLKEGFTFKTNPINKNTGDLYAYCHLKIDNPIKELRFNYEQIGETMSVPITLLDAAANELWRFDGKSRSSKLIELKDLKVRGQLVFRIEKDKGVEVTNALSHVVSNIKFTLDDTKPVIDKDGFILVDNITDFRGYAAEDNVKIKLKPGPYKIDKSYCTRFVELSGNNCQYDLNGVSIMVNTKLFANKSLARGNSEKSLYCALEISGTHTTMEGPYIETYGNYYGHQSKNKIFNLVGVDVTLKNAEVRTAGSNPWGYGSFYGLGGNDVRKMNGIRIGYPAEDIKLIGCKVHMRAMGHAIFVQGAKNTLIEDCHVDGLLRTTDDILAEKSGYAFDKNFKAAKGGYVEGAIVAEDGSFLPGEMFSMSEDGIRIYTGTSPGPLTGSTTIKDCTVTNMRRGICTGLNAKGDTVINCRVTNTIAAGFNVGNQDVLINCSADAKYAEAFCITNAKAKKASVDIEILDSREGMNNNLLAAINGTGHKVTIKTSSTSFIPPLLTIELSSRNGYAYYQRSGVSASDIQLDNQTEAKVLLLPGAKNAQIDSVGEVLDQTK